MNVLVLLLYFKTYYRMFLIKTIFSVDEIQGYITGNKNSSVEITEDIDIKVEPVKGTALINAKILTSLHALCSKGIFSLHFICNDFVLAF